MTPRKHSDIIKKWADGAEVQVLSNGEWCDIRFPRFIDTAEYRIKPKKIIRIALHRDMDGSNIPIMWSNAGIFEEVEKYESFIQWLTGEIEYEM